MKRICTLLAVSSLSLASLTAQTVSDDFNDNSRDAVLWEDPELDGGLDGSLDEVNSHLELSASAAVENYIFQEAKLYPTYNQAWQATAIVSLNKVDFGSGGIGFVVLEAGSNTPGDNYVAIGNGAGFLPGSGANGQAVVTDGGDSTTEDNLETFETAVPQAIGVKIAYDPRSRTIHTFYDLDTDQADGEWTLLKSYTIDGSSAPVGGLSLDWGLSANDTFRIQLNGGSENAGVSVGNAWFDDFQYIPGATIPVPTFADDFDDNSRDVLNWMAPSIDSPGTNGDLAEQNQRLEFLDSGANDQWITQQLNHYPGYDEPWQVQMLASVAESGLGVDQVANMSIEVGSSTPESRSVEIGVAAGVIPELPLGEGIFAAGADSTSGEDPEFTIFSSDLPDVVGLRMTYDPNTRLIRTYYHLDADMTDGEWTLLATYSIDGSAPAGVTNLNWAMSGANNFFINLIGASEGNAVITSGEAWADDFEFNRGSTAQASTLAFSDDFNDDSVDLNWGAPNIDEGTPSLAEVNHRTELVSTATSGANELSRDISDQYFPRYDQAFEVRLDAHCLPAAVTAGGGLSLVELLVGNSSGDQDLLTSIGRGDVGGGFGHFRFSDDSQTAPDELPENREEAITLPDIVSIRMVWNPDTEVMSCYFDTDGDPSVDSWELFSSYSLDGSGSGGTATDWGMAPSDRFFIGFAMLAEDAAVTSGEVYVDNFFFVSEAALTGYDQWASAIPDPGQRSQTVDASGNGIPNLLQYMYGLAPMDTDTDVKLRIQMEGGFPVIYHGVNETAPDYYIWYEFKNSLSDPWVFAVGDEATSSEIVQINGKTLNKLTFPTSTINNFVRLMVLPY